MESILFIALIVGLVAYWANYRVKQEMDDNCEARKATINQHENKNSMNQNQESDTPGLMFSTLNNLGC